MQTEEFARDGIELFSPHAANDPCFWMIRNGPAQPQMKSIPKLADQDL